MLELVSEGQRVVVPCELEVLSHLVLEVADIGASSMPTNFLRLSHLFRVNRHFHSVVEHAVWLVVVEDVEFNWQVFGRVRYLKIEPLCVSARVRIVLHK